MRPRRNVSAVPAAEHGRQLHTPLVWGIRYTSTVILHAGGNGCLRMVYFPGLSVSCRICLCFNPSGSSFFVCLNPLAGAKASANCHPVCYFHPVCSHSLAGRLPPDPPVGGHCRMPATLSAVSAGGRALRRYPRRNVASELRSTAGSVTVQNTRLLSGLLSRSDTYPLSPQGR